MVYAEYIEEITKTELDFVITIAKEVIEESIREKAIEDINDIYEEGDLVYRNSDVENFYYDVGLQPYNKNLDEFKKRFYSEFSEMMLSQFKIELEYDDDDFIEAIQEAREKQASLKAAIKLKIDDWFPTTYKFALKETEDIFICDKKYQEDCNEQARIEEEKINRKKMPYLEFLKTEYWQEVRSKIIARDKCCRMCGKKIDFEVHHIYYTHRGDELNHLDDLTLVCSNCHQIIHTSYTWN